MSPRYLQHAVAPRPGPFVLHNTFFAFFLNAQHMDERQVSQDSAMHTGIRQIRYPIILVSDLIWFVPSFQGKLGWRLAVRRQPCGESDIQPIPFGMRNLPLATLDIVIIRSTIVVWS